MQSGSFWFLLLGVLLPGVIFGLLIFYRANIFFVILLLTYILTVIMTFMPKRTGSS